MLFRLFTFNMCSFGLNLLTIIPQTGSNNVPFPKCIVYSLSAREAHYIIVIY
jgi:hypothetical protein